MRSGDKVVTMNGEIVDGRERQVQLQRLPVIAVVGGEIHAALGAGKEQSLMRRIFVDGAHERPLADPADDELPRLAVVARAIDIRTLVVQSMPIDRRISRTT